MFYSHKMYYSVLFTHALPCLDMVLCKSVTFYLDMVTKVIKCEEFRFSFTIVYNGIHIVRSYEPLQDLAIFETLR